MFWNKCSDKQYSPAVARRAVPALQLLKIRGPGFFQTALEMTRRRGDHGVFFIHTLLRDLRASVPSVFTAAVK